VIRREARIAFIRAVEANGADGVKEINAKPESEQKGKNRGFYFRSQKWKSHDYGFVAPWGSLTEVSLEKLYEKGNTEFTMKDKSTVVLCKFSDWDVKIFPSIEKKIYSWMKINPGR
jgi:hypothetical protein